MLRKRLLTISLIISLIIVHSSILIFAEDNLDSNTSGGEYGTEIEGDASYSIFIKGAPESLYKNDSCQLSVSFDPEDAGTDKTITWTSSDPTIARVSKTGEVTAIREGNVTIIASVNDVSAKCSIECLEKHATELELNKSEIELPVGESTELSVSYLPEDSTDEVIWRSSDPGIASVDDSGRITAVAEGTVTISASMGELVSECIVNVSATAIDVYAEGYTYKSIRVTWSKDIQAVSYDIYRYENERDYNYMNGFYGALEEYDYCTGLNRKLIATVDGDCT